MDAESAAEENGSEGREKEAGCRRRGETDVGWKADATAKAGTRRDADLMLARPFPSLFT